MTGKTKKIIFGIEIVVFIISLMWLYKNREHEPLIAVLLSFAAIIATIFIKGKDDNDSNSGDSNSKPKKVKIKQKAGKKSKQYASGGDMTINEK